MKTTSIVIEDLEKTYITLRGSVTALKKIDLEIKPGEFFVLLGPSGCGKSTLLNLIAGLEKPTRGKMKFGERVVAAPQEKIFLTPFQRDISMVFQSYALYPHMTIGQNIAFPLTNIKGKDKPTKEELKEKVKVAAETLQITNLLDRKPSELSGGQRQRVAIGRAIVRNPEIFLMDEPLSNLDAKLRMEMRAQLKALQQDLGVTTVYVTHDQLEAMTLGDRIAIINDGYIQQLDTPVDVYDKPINTFIARFIGSPPMNLIRGEVTEKDGKTVIQDGPVEVNLPQNIANKMKEIGDKSYIVGIRPEDVKLAPKGQGNLDVRVDVVENIGSEFLINVFLGGNAFKTFIIRTADYNNEKEIALKFPEEKIHIFSTTKEGGPRLN